MDRDEVLAHHGHGNEPEDEHPFSSQGRFGICFAAAAELADEEISQDLWQPGRGHTHRKSSQKGIAQRNLGAAAQAVLEGDHGGIKPHARQEPADDGS